MGGQFHLLAKFQYPAIYHWPKPHYSLSFCPSYNSLIIFSLIRPNNSWRHWYESLLGSSRKVRGLVQGWILLDMSALWPCSEHEENWSSHWKYVVGITPASITIYAVDKEHKIWTRVIYHCDCSSWCIKWVLIQRKFGPICHVCSAKGFIIWRHRQIASAGQSSYLQRPILILRVCKMAHWILQWSRCGFHRSMVEIFII